MVGCFATGGPPHDQQKSLAAIEALAQNGNLAALGSTAACRRLPGRDRLGTFLFRRIQKAGKDACFDEIKPSFFRFLNFWTLQGLWVTFTVAAALAAITTTVRKELGLFALIGSLVWVFGFAMEAMADAQKSRFRADPENKGKFIQTGLWAWSRHPNYFGEIVIWIGVAIIALPVLRGWQWVTLISPVFVALLIARVSGVPMLEKWADEK